MFSRFDTDIENLEHRVALLRLESGADLARVQERTLAALTSPVSLAIAGAAGALLGLITARRGRSGGSFRAKVAGPLLAATGAWNTLARLAAASRLVIERYALGERGGTPQ